MKPIRWSDEKSTILRGQKTRSGIGFEHCVAAIENGKILDIVTNPSRNHSSQQMYIININNYAYCVPFVESETEIFLKTVFPNRRMTAKYLDRLKHEKN